MKILIATVLSALVAATALAKDAEFKACTKDDHQALLVTQLVDDASKDVEADIQKAFTETARALSLADLQSYEGYLAFAARLNDEDRAAIQNLNRPTDVGSCRRAH